MVGSRRARMLFSDVSESKVNTQHRVLDLLDVLEILSQHCSIQMIDNRIAEGVTAKPLNHPIRSHQHHQYNLKMSFCILATLILYSYGSTYNNTDCGNISGRTMFSCLTSVAHEQLLYPGTCGKIHRTTPVTCR
jgi:hypothetical protein